MTSFTLEDLAAIIAARANASATASYTKSLLDGGPARAAKKLGEEAVETVIAAVQGDAEALTRESADLLYHLLVVLHQRGISLADVCAELEHRTGRSGHAEKAARQADPAPAED
ncbi:phosphoribosyl-ATP diphosphatase [Methylocapsa sp. D3K7]|uniref:phosphoribosyl-ATP diphosphatase n=1 Tax=Methylocapsa sp. D3K7 TaxID=3041435 RepID=UPI00244EBCE3|nr:phosphoribosyl-ATP diphosphatase [Methylocapsa sp. D3K7]WGJ13460.1 phosphoribosyl-ATP diphosphatase [Methylocapsa sp. D3K7]